MKECNNEPTMLENPNFMRGCIVILKEELCLQRGIVTLNQSVNSEVCIPRNARGVITFVYADDSCQVNFTGHGSFMIDFSWLTIA
jgi:hypothetical protein